MEANLKPKMKLRKTRRNKLSLKLTAFLLPIKSCWGVKTYLMNCCILEFVFLFVIENKAVFLDIADNWCLPSRALQESNKAIEDPILCKA